METLKFKKLYLLINVPMLLIFVILLFMPLFMTGRSAEVYYIGIAARIIMGIWFIFNGLWNGCTDYYSIIKNNKYQQNTKAPKWIWWLIIIIGVGCIITAFMGYGFNGAKKPS